MKKMIFGAAALVLLAAASCKKSDDNGTPANTWSVGGTSYTSLSTVGQGGGGTYVVTAAQGTGTSTNSIMFSFNGSSLPTAGNYTVVANATAANQVSFSTIQYSTSTFKTYSSTGSGDVTPTLTINRGKVPTSMPDAWAKASSTDSVKVNANISAN